MFDDDARRGNIPLPFGVDLSRVLHRVVPVSGSYGCGSSVNLVGTSTGPTTGVGPRVCMEGYRRSRVCYGRFPN